MQIGGAIERSSIRKSVRLDLVRSDFRAPLAPLVDADVLCDPNQPSAEIAVAEVVYFLVCAEEGSLSSIFSGASIRKKPSARQINSFAVPDKQFGEALRISGRLKLANELLVREFTFCSSSYRHNAWHLPIPQAKI